MTWRTVVVGSRAKLDFKMNYMIVRKEGETNKIYLNEIYALIIESTAVSMTAALLNELVKSKVKVIFCDETRNPAAELIPHHGAYNTSLKYREQIQWNEEMKKIVWTELVREKISNQAKLLVQCHHQIEASMLYTYIEELTLNDETQREGHAAKVYFNALFGKDFSRSQENNINAALNYGYSIILSAINREIAAMGYITQLGLCHKNQFNPFNLGSDLIESLRGVVDSLVVSMNLTNFTKDEKYALVGLLTKEVKIGNTIQLLSGAIRIYCKSIMDALMENDMSVIRFVDYEL